MFQLGRRELFAALMAGGGAAVLRGQGGASGTGSPFGLPGPYPGRVIEVAHAHSCEERRYNREAVRDMLRRGMMELTGAPSWEDAFRVFFRKGDVVGLKLNPVGRPHVISSPEVVQEIIASLNAIGIPHRDIVAYDRYKREFIQAGFDKWLPQGVRWIGATDQPHPLQLDMDGYDETQYVELPLALPKANPSDPHHRRSYLSRFITKEVNKLINLCVLKHHQSAGITLALKNLSHGLVNNVSRSHSTPSNNSCGTFIPAIVDHRIIRQKTVLNITDAVLAAYHGGPGGKVRNYVWEHKTMYFSTDPVAMDRVGWEVLDEKRKQMGREPLALAQMDADSSFVRMQPEHVDIAGTLGLGISDLTKIDLRKIQLA
jgi:uncharacterized protein (DUF362 family)